MIEIRQLERLMSKARQAEDALQRALDVCENLRAPGSVDYIRKQVDLAHDCVIEMTSYFLAYGHTLIEMALQTAKR